jgi:hypothetical protein
MFAWINNSEELLPTTMFFAQTILGALASGFGATLLFLIVSKIRRRTDYVFSTIAYCSSLFGMMAYAFYAYSGKADSMHSAAHMHVIVFPLLHGFLTIVAIIVGAILSTAIYFLFQRKKQTQQDVALDG